MRGLKFEFEFEFEFKFEFKFYAGSSFLGVIPMQGTEGSIGVILLFLFLAVALIVGVRGIAVTAVRQRREAEEREAYRRRENDAMRKLTAAGDEFKRIEAEVESLCEGMDEEERKAMWKPVDEKVSAMLIVLLESGFAAALPLQEECNTLARQVLAARLEALGISQ